MKTLYNVRHHWILQCSGRDFNMWGSCIAKPSSFTPYHMTLKSSHINCFHLLPISAEPQSILLHLQKTKRTRWTLPTCWKTLLLPSIKRTVNNKRQKCFFLFLTGFGRSLVPYCSTLRLPRTFATNLCDGIWLACLIFIFFFYKMELWNKCIWMDGGMHLVKICSVLCCEWWTSSITA